MTEDSRQQVEQNIKYYEGYAEEYHANTKHLDLSVDYSPFLQHLPSGGTILDAGCGPGRDSLHFLQKGYQVTAFDATRAMVNLAADHSGLDVLHLRFEQLIFESQFDGIWASASLLHVPRSMMDDVLQRLTRALKTPGVLLMSFKYGEGEIEHRGRWFNCYMEPALRALIARQAALRVIDLWVRDDTRPERKGQQWIYALVRKG